MEGPLVYHFAGFSLDAERRRLTRDGLEVALPERAISVLLELVSRCPEVVTKHELMDAAWPDVVVVEDNLVQAIRTIRNVLGGDSKHPRFVQTVHRRGYRFVAQVSSGSRLQDEAPQAPQSGPDPTSHRLRVALLLILLAGLVAASGWLLRRDATAPSADVTIHSLAVLPLDNLSDDPDQEYFADGMTDVLITELARNPTLEVISRTSVMKFKDTLASVPEISRTLGVDALVEGTVTRSGDRVRVIAQLVDSRDRHVWGESYEYDLRDILELQRNAARAIAGEIGARLTDQTTDTRQRRVDPEALEHYLRGLHVARRRTKESLHHARELFASAIAADPRYAPAYAGLADCYNLLANYGFEPSTEVRPQARLAAEKAIALDPDLAEAHVALAIVQGSFEWDFAAAEAAFQRALDLSPSSVIAHSRHAQLLVSQGRISDAVAEIRRAHRLDPLSDIIKANLGWFLFLDGQVADAELQLREVLEFNPSFAVAHFYLGVIYDRLERFDEAIAALDQACMYSDDSSYALGARIHALARNGERERADRELAAMLAQRDISYVSPIGLAVADFGLGKLDDGFLELERAFGERKGWLLHLRVEPALDAVREDPRYLDLVARVGLP